VAELRRSFRGVGQCISRAVYVVQAQERKALWRLERADIPGRIDGAEEEHTVFQDRTASLHTAVVTTRGCRLDRAVWCLHLRPGSLNAARTIVVKRRTLECIAAALRDDVDDAASGLAELCFIPSRFHFDVLDEVERGRVAQ